MANISSLPQEVLLAIFEHLQSPWPFNHWLIPSTAACRAWHPLAMSIAYRDIVAFNEDDVRKAAQHAKYIRSLRLGGRRRWHKRYAAVCPACAELRGMFHALAALEEEATPELEIDLQLFIHASIFSYVYTDDEPDPFAPRTADEVDVEGELEDEQEVEEQEESEHEEASDHESDLENDGGPEREDGSAPRDDCSLSVEGAEPEDAASENNLSHEDEAASEEEAMHSGDEDADSEANIDSEEEEAGLEGEPDFEAWIDDEDYENRQRDLDQGPCSDCPFFSYSLEAALSELPELKRVTSFSVTLAGSLASHSIWSAWLLASRMPAVSSLVLTVDQRSTSELDIPRRTFFLSFFLSFIV